MLDPITLPNNPRFIDMKNIIHARGENDQKRSKKVPSLLISHISVENDTISSEMRTVLRFQ